MLLNAKHHDQYGNRLTTEFVEAVCAVAPAEDHVACIRLATQAVSDARRAMLHAQARYIDACEHLWAVCHYGEFDEPEQQAIKQQDKAVLDLDLLTRPLAQIDLSETDLPAGIVKHLKKAGLRTMSELLEYVANGENQDFTRLTKITGIGSQKAATAALLVKSFLEKRNTE